MFTLRHATARFSPQSLQRPFRRKHLRVHLTSGDPLALRLAVPEKLEDKAASIVKPVVGQDIVDVQDLIDRINKLERLGQRVTVYPDAEEFIQQRLFQSRIQLLVQEIRRDPAQHPLRKSLLKSELLPYQLDGIAFAVGAGRAVLADDMGLGKTIQGVG